MRYLPEEIYRLIYRKVFSYCVYELQNFIDFSKVYIYKNPNILCPKNICFTIRNDVTYVKALSSQNNNNKYIDMKHILVMTDKYCTGDRSIHVLNFYQIILFFKHHSTGTLEDGSKIVPCSRVIKID
jgi:hypothetical protein